MAEPLALRLDDPGASTKRYEVYSNHSLRIRGRTVFSGNWLFLKYIPPFRRWGPYREMSAEEWEQVLDILAACDAKMTVGVTATWVKDQHTLIPFPWKFPEAAAVLRSGVKRGLIEIANHGLTHCVVKGDAFKPRLFSGNRSFHREFWEWIDPAIHETHIRNSQEILQDFFGVGIVTLIPPGNVFTEATLDAAHKHGLRYINCQTKERLRGRQIVIGNEYVGAFHDREIVLHGVKWLEGMLLRHKDKEFRFVRELAEARRAALQ